MLSLPNRACARSVLEFLGCSLRHEKLSSGNGQRDMITSRCPPANAALLERLARLPPGTVIAQLNDGSLAICASEEEADRRILESRPAPRDAGPANAGKSSARRRTSSKVC